MDAAQHISYCLVVTIRFYPMRCQVDIGANIFVQFMQITLINLPIATNKWKSHFSECAMYILPNAQLIQPVPQMACGPGTFAEPV